MPKKSIVYMNLPITIEYQAGDIREGTNRNGEFWQTQMSCGYGKINGVIGKDGETLDCYVKQTDKPVEYVFIIHQLTPDGKAHDEDKIMLGFDSIKEARKHYKHNVGKMYPFVYGGWSWMPATDFADGLDSAFGGDGGVGESVIANPHIVEMFTNQNIKTRGFLLVEAVPVFKLTPDEIHDYLEAMFTLPFQTQHKMSKRARKLFQRTMQNSIKSK